MHEKPTIPEAIIASSLEHDFGIHADKITFLPLGYDVHTAVYLVDAQDATSCFLKLRKGEFDPICVEVPSILSRLGIRAIIAPKKTLHGQLYSRLEEYSAILYPYVPGKDGYENKLSDSHWIELGRALRQIHSVWLPPGPLSRIPVEVFDPSWREDVRRFLSEINARTYDDGVAQKTVRLLIDKRQLILHMLQRAGQLAITLSSQPLEYVLCHTDAHPGNFYITTQGELYLVDWDNPLLAPRERDLMCFGSAMSGDQPGGREEGLFFQGYGSIEINHAALVYYRYEHILQDVAEFCKQLLLTSLGGDDREQAYFYRSHSFAPSREVDVALFTDQCSGLI